MLRIVSLAIFVLLVACSRYDAATDGGSHHYFAMGEAALHTERSLLEFLLDNSDNADGDIIIGPVELLGNGAIHVGAADYGFINRHIRPVHLVSTHNMYSPLLVEIEDMPDDSLSVLIKFSYTYSCDTLFEVVSGTLNIPLVRDTLSLHHRLILKGQPLYEAERDDGASQKMMLDLDCLLM